MSERRNDRRIIGPSRSNRKSLSNGGRPALDPIFTRREQGFAGELFASPDLAARIDRAEGRLCAAIAREFQHARVTELGGGGAVFVERDSPSNTQIGVGFSGAVDETALSRRSRHTSRRSMPVCRRRSRPWWIPRCIGSSWHTAMTDGRLESARIGLTGACSHATRMTNVEHALSGKPLSIETIATAARLAGTDLPHVNADICASESYRRAMIPVFTRRALEKAAARL